MIQPLPAPSQPPVVVLPSSSPPPRRGSFFSRSSPQGVFLLSGVIIILGSLNNVIGKIRSKPLGRFNYFVALFNSIVYTLVYGTSLAILYINGHIPKDNFTFMITPRNLDSTMTTTIRHHDSQPTQGRHRSSTTRTSSYHFSSLFFSICPWQFLLVSGLLDGWGNLLGLIAQPYISGPLYSLMLQSSVPFSAIASCIALRRRYGLYQVLALFTVFGGFLVAWAPMSFSINQESEGTGRSGLWTLGYALLAALSTLPTTISFTLKEKVMIEYGEWVEKKSNINRSSSISTTTTTPTFNNNSSHAINICGSSNSITTTGSRGICWHSPARRLQTCVFPTEPSCSHTRNDEHTGKNNLCTTLAAQDFCSIYPSSVCHPSFSNPSSLLSSSSPLLSAPSTTSTPLSATTSSLSPLTATTTSSRHSAKISIFVICTIASIFQMLTMPASLPINVLLGQTRGESVGQYSHEALRCFEGHSEFTGFSPLSVAANQLSERSERLLPSAFGENQREKRGLIPRYSRQLEDSTILEFTPGPVQYERSFETGIGGVIDKEPWSVGHESVVDRRKTVGEDLCKYSLPAYVVYVIINILFNLVLIGFLRIGSTLLAFLSLKAVLPLSLILFYIAPWPLLSQEDVHFSLYIIVSLVLIALGIFWFEYERQNLRREQVESEQHPCCFPLFGRPSTMTQDEE